MLILLRLVPVLLLIIIICLSKVTLTINAYDGEYLILIEFVIFALEFKSGEKDKRNKFFPKKGRIKPILKSVSFLIKRTDVKLYDISLLSQAEGVISFLKSSLFLSSIGVLIYYLKKSAKSFTIHQDIPRFFLIEDKKQSQNIICSFNFRFYNLIISLLILLYYNIIEKIKGVRQNVGKQNERIN